MGQTSLRNNPLLAALLGIVVTGLGHLYLRRWRRAIGWLGVTAIASVLLIPKSTISAINSGALTNPVSLLPVVLISAVSVLDAYLIAKLNTRTKDIQAGNTPEPTGSDESPACPACGKPVDPELGFCHWCTTEFDVEDISEQDSLNENHSNGQ